MQEINAWLNSKQDFKVGSDLYIKYGTNNFFKSLLLSQGPTPYNIQKLVSDLEGLAPAEPAPADEPNPVIEPSPLKVPETEQPKRSKDLEFYLQIKEQQKTLYRQLERCMIELDLDNRPRFLHLTSNQILSLHKKIQDLHKLIDIYDETGAFPKEKATIIKSAQEEIQLLRVSISKAKTRLKSPNCRDAEQTEKLIAENKKRIIELGGTVK